jgi:LTXXQ motif family protein
MTFPAKALIIATSLTAITAATVGAEYLRPPGALWAKDSSRVTQAVGRNYQDDKSGAVELAQADGPSSFSPMMSFPRGVPLPPGPTPMIFDGPMGPPGPMGQHGPMPPMGAHGPLGPRGPMGPHGPMGPDGMMEPPRRECLENIHRHAALAGYLKSKLRLQESQKEAWRKIEEAAGPAVEAMLVLCDQLPDLLGPPPPMSDMIDFAEKEQSAHAAFLRAIRDPFRALYDSLTTQQRALLQLPPPNKL